MLCRSLRRSSTLSAPVSGASKSMAAVSSPSKVSVKVPLVAPLTVTVMRFDVFVPLKSENRLMIYELYEDQAALDAHAGTDRIKEHRNNTKELVENRSLHICDLRDSGDM